MHLLPADEHQLGRALTLAREAAAFASPNPAVGCVLTRHSEVLAEGAHRFDGRDHAEIVALKQASRLGRDVRGATAYVTLEPCSHHGRTGPCADALVAAGVARCVVATVDPNPLVRGRGLARLRAAGLEVVLAGADSSLAQAARRLNDAFAFAIQFARPFVTLKTALSADGRLAPSPKVRVANKPHWITGPAARAEVQELRHRADALLCGVGTVLADDPALSDRTGLPRRRPLLRVVADVHLRTPVHCRLVREVAGDLLLVAGANASQDRVAALREAGAEVVRLPTNAGRVPLRSVLDLLRERQLQSVLLEAGSALNGSMLQQDLVDRVVMYRGPQVFGEDGIPFAEGAGSPDALLARISGAQDRRLVREDGQHDLVFTGYLHDPWAGI